MALGRKLKHAHSLDDGMSIRSNRRGSREPRLNPHQANGLVTDVLSTVQRMYRYPHGI
jgi:hypothetical protein